MRANWTHGWRVALLVMLLTVAVDLTSKQIAERELAGRPRRSLVAGLVRLEYRENRAGFWGMGASRSERARNRVFGVGVSIVVAGMGLLLGWLTYTRRPNLGLSLLFSGGVANQLSRMSRGSVTDFVNVGVGWLRTRTFNLADVAILAGAILVVAEWYGCAPSPRQSGVDRGDEADEETRHGGSHPAAARDAQTAPRRPR